MVYFLCADAAGAMSSPAHVCTSHPVLCLSFACTLPYPCWCFSGVLLGLCCPGSGTAWINAGQSMLRPCLRFTFALPMLFLLALSAFRLLPAHTLLMIWLRCDGALPSSACALFLLCLCSPSRMLPPGR
eukprot:9634637-Alexandrium_andersonii.AAC.1